MSSQPVDVVKVARRTFSEEEEDETIQIPPNYLDSLTTFFAHYPYDDLFIIAKGEGNGLGVITCMEEGCYCDIILEANPDAWKQDGGLSEGIGSLHAYMEHIDTHRTHAAHRNIRCADRIKADAAYGPVVSNAVPSATASFSVPRSASQRDGKQTALTAQSYPTPSVCPSSSTASTRPPAMATAGAGSSFSAYGNGSSNSFASASSPSPQSSFASSSSAPHRTRPRSSLLDSLSAISSGKDVKPKIDADANPPSSPLSQLSSKKRSIGETIAPSSTSGPSKKTRILTPTASHGSLNSASSSSSVSADVKPASKIEPVAGTLHSSAAASLATAGLDSTKVTMPAATASRLRLKTGITLAEHLSNWTAESAILQRITAPEAYQTYLRSRISTIGTYINAADARTALGFPPPSQTILDIAPAIAQFYDRIPAPASIVASASPFVAKNYPTPQAQQLAWLAEYHTVQRSMKRKKGYARQVVQARLNLLTPGAIWRHPQPLPIIPPPTVTDAAHIPLIALHYNRVSAAPPPPPRAAPLHKDDQIKVAIQGAHDLLYGRPQPVAGPSNLNIAAGGMAAALGITEIDGNDDDDEIPEGEGGEFARKYAAAVAAAGAAGPGGEAQMADFFSKCLEDFTDSHDVNQARQKLNIKDVEAKIPGMLITLMPHQIIGLCFMSEKEKDVKLRGGILGDAMGLGKTVQAIALMTIRPSDDPKRKTNLIVAPVALLDQWKIEIESKTEEGLFSCLVYHGANKTRSVKELQKYDVILTSYGTIVSSFPKADKKKKRKAKVLGQLSDSDSDGAAAIDKKKLGPLARMGWHRIILDEAQQIRNKGTKLSSAITELDADYRWALTGTIITNGLEDVYAQLRFLNISPYNEWSEFRNHIVQPSKKRPQIAATRVQAILRRVMIRRSKDSKVDGKPILALKAKNSEHLSLEFSAQEREIYQGVEARARIKFNKFLKAGTALKNYSHLLTMLLRLRQLTNHPLLIARAKGEEFSAEDLMLEADDELRADREYEIQGEVERAIKVLGPEKVKVIQERFKLRAADRNRIATDLDAEIEVDECPICSDQMDAPLITGCGHEYCKECLLRLMDMGAEQEYLAEDGGGPKPEKLCPVCREPLKSTEIFSAQAFGPRDAFQFVKAEPDFVKPELGPTAASASRASESVSERLAIKNEPAMHENEMLGAAPKGEPIDVDKGVFRLKAEPAEAIIVISDDEDEDMPDVATAAKGRRPKMVVDSDDDDETKPDIKGKGKARSKPVKKARTRKPKRKSGRGFIVNSDGETDSDFNIDTDSNATSESDDESDGSIIDRKGKGRALSFSPMPEYIKSRAQLEKEENMKIDYEHAEPSTKIKMIIELVEDWRTNFPNEKIIIFSQFVTFINILEVLLRKNGFKSERYEGSMNIKARDAVIRNFTKPNLADRDAAILLISLKCGGVGLNLTRANRVISCDLAWNRATEDQATDRVHRIGQTRVVEIRKLVVANTVEQRVLELQERKSALADGALGEGTGRKIGRLTLADLKMLFGM